jgi:hypothetical protein
LGTLRTLRTLRTGRTASGTLGTLRTGGARRTHEAVKVVLHSACVAKLDPQFIGSRDLGKTVDQVLAGITLVPIEGI